MNQRYKVRITVIFLFFCAIYAAILINLFMIQVRHSSFFINMAEKQYLVTMTSTPARALILDRNGQPLAMNKESISAFILPTKLENKQKTVAFLKAHFPHAYKRFDHSATHHFMFVKRRLTPAELHLIEQCGLEDIHLLKEPSRFYPVPCAGCITGITDIDNNGLFGIELQFNQQLAGKPTVYALEKDARSGKFYFKKETKVAGNEGTDIQLTIDNDLQFLAYEELKTAVNDTGAKEGCVIIINPQTGELLVMANMPTFDPNATTELNMEQTKNKILTEAYEIGSVMKAFAALAALEEKVVTLEEEIDCENKKTTFINKRRVNTPFANGVLPFSQVIATSNNIGTAKVMLRLDTKLYDHYKRLGFGTKTGIEFPGEQSGFVNHPDNWSKQSLFSLSYGYEITGTLLQLARSMCIIANGGYAIKPTIIKHNVKSLGKKLYSDETITQIKEVLLATVEGGSAFRTKINGYTIRCKTGTAILLEDGKYKENKNIYTCAGIVEKDTYQRVIVAFIKEADRKNAFAATIAVPLFKRVAQRMIIHDKVIT